jgi:drug/metabolite transporter (DMT)-like permease
MALGGLAVFSTACAFCIFFRLVHTLGSVGTTAQAYLRVPVGVAIGAYFLGEQLSDTAWLGLICVVLGVAAMTLPGRKTTATAHKPV